MLGRKGLTRGLQQPRVRACLYSNLMQSLSQFFLHRSDRQDEAMGAETRIPFQPPENSLEFVHPSRVWPAGLGDIGLSVL